MYAFIQDVPITEELYAKIRAALGSEPLPGQIVHVVLKREDGLLRYVDVWESKQACDAAFETRVHPAVYSVFREAKFRPAGEPKREEMAAIEVAFGVGRGAIAS
jgi:predicted urease superfamily metal-dependent hydrolase